MNERKHTECNLEKHRSPISYGRTGGMMDDKYCKDHKVVVCKCGWEMLWHYGTYSREGVQI